MKEVFESLDSVYIVLELVTGSELFERLVCVYMSQIFIFIEKDKKCRVNTVTIYIKHESCVFAHTFLSHQKSQLHEILVLRLILANLKHDEARYLKLLFSRGVPTWSSVKMSNLVVNANLSHLRT